MNITRSENEYCSCNNCTSEWINKHLDPRKTVDHVEIFVMMAVVFMMVLTIGAPWRRRSSLGIVKYGVGGVFILSSPLASYSLGLLQQGPIIRTELNTVWVIFLVLLLGGTNAMSVRKLDENKQWRKLYLEGSLFLFYATDISSFQDDHKYSSSVFVGFMVLKSLFVLTYLDRVFATMLASTSSNGIKMISQYMKEEHTHSTSHDPRTMQGYRYKVLIHIENGVTLEQIWCSDTGILSSSSTKPHVSHLKDLCLSFSLFHLLVRRYFGHTCPESKHEKTRALVLQGLLGDEQGYERAFRVIEVELGFVYDFFFTKYATIMDSKQVWVAVRALGITLLSLAVGILALSDVKEGMPTFLPVDSGTIKTWKIDIIATKVALYAIVVLQLVQTWCYYVSDWVKVSLVCKYVENHTWCTERLLLFLGTPTNSLFPSLFLGQRKCFGYWSNTVGQYSPLDSFSQKCHWFGQGRKAGKPKPLPVVVKNAVLTSIKVSDCQLSNGTSALRNHGMYEQLNWTINHGMYEQFTLTHSILVWHIATSYRDMISFSPVSLSDEQIMRRTVANILSKYCAYLVLPGNPIETESTLDELVKEARETLGNLVSADGKYNTLRQLEYSSADTILFKGALLGRELENMDYTARWKLLEAFWAEMMVYIAPSDNVADHIEHLAQGGEFVTHIWALLMHAGVLHRPAAATATATAVI